jgi:hypothetical protein
MPDLVRPTQFDRGANDAGCSTRHSDEWFQLGDSSEGSMAQLHPTTDTDTTAAIDSGA